MGGSSSSDCTNTSASSDRRAAHADAPHAGAARRLDPGGRVLDDDAVRRRHAEPERRGPEDLGIGLAGAHVLGRDDRVEATRPCSSTRSITSTFARGADEAIAWRQPSRAKPRDPLGGARQRREPVASARGGGTPLPSRRRSAGSARASAPAPASRAGCDRSSGRSSRGTASSVIDTPSGRERVAPRHASGTPRSRRASRRGPRGRRADSVSARSTRPGRACAGSACRRGTGRARGASGASVRAAPLDPREVLEHARRARSPRTASAPQVNGPWFATSTAGDLGRREPGGREGLDDHEAGVALVVALDLVARSAARVTGMSPRKWSACVVPMQRIGSRTCANAVANSECVWTMPPQSKARYSSRCVGVSDDGRRSPSTHLAGLERHGHHVRRRRARRTARRSA